MLTTTGSPVNDGATLRYRASKYDCQTCHLKTRCCPKEPARYVPRSIYEGARDMARGIAKSWEGRVSRRLRKKIEMLFAHLKRILKLDRLRLRGPNGARDEFLLAATAQNLRKLAKLIPAPNLKRARRGRRSTRPVMAAGSGGPRHSICDCAARRSGFGRAVDLDRKDQGGGMRCSGTKVLPPAWNSPVIRQGCRRHPSAQRIGTAREPDEENLRPCYP